MNTSVDVLAVIDRAIERVARPHTEGLHEARAAIAELIDADEEFDAAGESLELIQNSSSPRSYAILNAAIESYEYSRIRRSAALSRVKGA